MVTCRPQRIINVDIFGKAVPGKPFRDSSEKELCKVPLRCPRCENITMFEWERPFETLHFPEFVKCRTGFCGFEGHATSWKVVDFDAVLRTAGFTEARSEEHPGVATYTHSD